MIQRQRRANEMNEKKIWRIGPDLKAGSCWPERMTMGATVAPAPVHPQKQTENGLLAFGAPCDLDPVECGR